MSSPVGMMKFPTEWKNKSHVMFQTTNQYIIYEVFVLGLSTLAAFLQ
jgi:hypothetical protein